MKIARQSKIVELINEYDIETQEELAARLNAAGFKVTQATVSRDIREMKLMKMARQDGGSKYGLVSSPNTADSEKVHTCVKRRLFVNGYCPEYSGY